MAVQDATVETPSLCKLSIERFRGIKELTWYPSKGVNVIVGGGDSGKTTILDAVGLLLSPVNAGVSDTDYEGRVYENGFVIEGILMLPLGSGIGDQLKATWPWIWDGKDAVVPSADAAAAQGPAVYRVRVRGTEDLELAYELLQPDGSIEIFPVALRRSIGLVRLSGDDRNDRDLRLVQGSALDKLLSDKALRSRLATELAQTKVKTQLSEDAQKSLTGLDDAFKSSNLPTGLDLAITGGQGASVASMVGLTANRHGIQLPLSCWGAGTRRLSALAIAEQNQGNAPIAIVDEIERGLEPYRQRALMAKLEASQSQIFITTHSPAALSAGKTSHLWHLDHTGKIGPLKGDKIAKHRAKDPDTFLSRVAVIVEGATEDGFTQFFLEKALAAELAEHGVHTSDAVGHETALDLLEALAKGGLLFGGFVDNEGKYPHRWKALQDQIGPLLFRWKKGCTEPNVIDATPEENLEALITDPTGKKTGMRLHTLAERLSIEDKTFAAIKAKAGGDLKNILVAACLGQVPISGTHDKGVYKGHAKVWFKSRAGGRELAAKVLILGGWPVLKPVLLPFCNAVRRALGLPEIGDLLQ